MPNIGRCDRNIGHELLFHLLNEAVVLHIVVQIVADLRDALALILLQFLTRAGRINPKVDLLVYGLCNFRLGDIERVDGCLMQKEFLNSNLFRDSAVGIAFPFHAFHLAL